MTEIEEKSLRTQLAIAKEIIDADKQIIYQVHITAQALLNEVILTKQIRDVTTVELPIDEFEKIREVLFQLKDYDGFCKMTSWMKAQYIAPRDEKLKILTMLQ